MNIVWTQETIESYRQASEYTAFHKKLAILAQPYLDADWTLADIGCGPGLLDFALAPMVRSVTAIDRDELCIRTLDKELDRVYYTNRAVAEKIEPRLADAHSLGDERWDAVVTAFFGVDGTLLEKLIGHARRRALIFTRGRASSSPVDAGFGESEQEPKLSAEEIEAHLAEAHYAFKKTGMEMQFGQPFKKIEDIHRFLAGTFGSEGEEAERRAADAEERIVKTNRFDYPYYLPKNVSVTLFVVAARA
ncbi:MAG: class I SAM-dependent methyltransferase [Clostridiales Family XIII bacterium]|jgi:SAM-dependent methyltransferase|nr:class I SAM-dependent methyltransferase [Clostridiales Family XIII bacterium]